MRINIGFPWGFYITAGVIFFVLIIVVSTRC